MTDEKTERCNGTGRVACPHKHGIGPDFCKAPGQDFDTFTHCPPGADDYCTVPADEGGEVVDGGTVAGHTLNNSLDVMRENGRLRAEVERLETLRTQLEQANEEVRSHRNLAIQRDRERVEMLAALRQANERVRKLEGENETLRREGGEEWFVSHCLETERDEAEQELKDNESLTERLAKELEESEADLATATARIEKLERVLRRVVKSGVLCDPGCCGDDCGCNDARAAVEKAMIKTREGV